MAMDGDTKASLIYPRLRTGYSRRVPGQSLRGPVSLSLYLNSFWKQWQEERLYKWSKGTMDEHFEPRLFSQCVRLLASSHMNLA
eukprot:881010-Amphidinium_carterae.2